jgi:hypothetical protein
VAAALAREPQAAPDEAAGLCGIAREQRESGRLHVPPVLGPAVAVRLEDRDAAIAQRATGRNIPGERRGRASCDEDIEASENDALPR